WAVLDELGYLESGCADFQQSVLDLLKVCRVLAVVRKQDTPFLRALCADPDAFVYDLDCPVPPLGCIVMASGLGRRFGGNKLMAELNGRPLAAHALALAAAPVFAGRIAVTRSAEVEALCRAGGFPVLRHAEPRRSDTVRLGLTALLAQQPDLQGCVFLPGDRPCLPRQTLEALAIGAAPDTIRRPAAPDGTPGSPVLFGRDYFAALLHLPEGSGGSAVLRAHPQAIRLLPTPAAELRDIDTRSDLEALRGGKV
ncbi:NTP transferase domain-containing protein, partial [uncultured Gemmiger sp.]|uniref:NTP transferase domain-containing protein n=1 Tax=uncultured Gemmiger sp. TaxID=1623490 RepID=UPI0025FE6C21